MLPSSLPSSMTHLNLNNSIPIHDSGPHIDPIGYRTLSSLEIIPSVQNPHPPFKPHRHSFWSGLGLRDRSNSRKNSSVTLAAYPNQIYKSPTMDSMARQPTTLGPSRAIAMVGNIRRGIGRMILEELVTQKFIVVALIDKVDGDFSRSVEVLASSPSLFHAFVVEGGLFGQAIVGSDSDELGTKILDLDHDRIVGSVKSSRRKSFRSFRLSSKRSNPIKGDTPVSSATCSSTLGDSITELSSHSSILSSPPSSLETARLRSIGELKNIFQAYRVDTVICSFEPQVVEEPAGPRSKARLDDEKQFGLPPAAERARIECMERTVLEACLASGAVGRFAVTVHSTSLGPSVLSPHPVQSIRPHLLSVFSGDEARLYQRPPISITEFRWGFLMNELAIDDGLVDGATAENGLGKWLCEPPKSRWILDYDHRKFMVPVKTASTRDTTEKGKQKLEPVCMTLAEDAARFIGLACKLKGQWEWKTGKMVGDFVQGGWEEVIETVEKISKKQFQREYVCVGSMSSGYASDSGSSNSSLEQQKQLSNLDLTDSTGIVHHHRLLVEEIFKYEDELRGSLAKENRDASSVRLREFVRVWFTPLPQPPSIVVDGNRIRRKSSRVGIAKSTPARIGQLKPQVAENGTLREVPIKGGSIHHLKKPVEGGTTHQFPHLASHPSSLPPFVHRPVYPQNSPDPRSQAQIPEQPIPGGPSFGGNNPVNLSRIPVPTQQHLGQQTSAEFNFVPKVIVPFNTTQVDHHPIARQQPGMINPQSSIHHPVGLRGPPQPPQPPQPHGMVYPTPIETRHGNPHRPQPVPPSKSMMGSRRPIESFNHPPHILNPSINHPHRNINHKGSGLSIPTSRENRDENRLLRRSPLATRVA